MNVTRRGQQQITFEALEKAFGIGEILSAAVDHSRGMIALVVKSDFEHIEGSGTYQYPTITTHDVIKCAR